MILSLYFSLELNNLLFSVSCWISEELSSIIKEQIDFVFFSKVAESFLQKKTLQLVVHYPHISDILTEKIAFF